MNIKWEGIFMKRLTILCLLSLFALFNADAAVPQQRRGQGAAASNNTGTVSTRTGATTARAATARSATAARAATPAVSARAATTGRTTVSRGGTATTAARAATPAVAARAATTQKVIGTGTKVAAAAENTVVSEECRQKYNGCMDSFCMLDNDSGGRCICSNRNAELDEVLAQIEQLDQQSYQMATYGVERIEMGDSADTVIANANAVAQSILAEDEDEQRQLLVSMWSNPSYLYDDADDIFADSGLANPIEGKTGDALLAAANDICVAQIPECSSEMSMLQLMYSQQVRSDCTAYENSLKQQKNASQQKLYAAETALRDAALEQYQTANKYDLGQCTIEFRNCMQTTGGCGDDFSGCASVAASDNTNTSNRRSNSNSDSKYSIKGEVTTIEIYASTYDTLLGKKPLCESVTKQCVAVADQVWDTFLRESAPAIKSAELIAEDNARQNCIGNISNCFQQACRDTMDPNDPEGSYDMCLTRPETMLNVCMVPLNACGIDASSAQAAEQSQIWEFVIARLQSMRVNSCTTQVKECLQSEDRCGPDYTQCIGLDTDTIIRMCPEELLVGCYDYQGGSTDPETGEPEEDFYTKLEPLVQGIVLNIDNAMLTQCQEALDEAMIRVCGDTEDCSGLTTDDNIGARSLEYKICQYQGTEGSISVSYDNCRPDASQILDAELGRVVGSTSGQMGNVIPFAGVIDGIIYWENVDIKEDGSLSTADEYIANLGAENLSEDRKNLIKTEIGVLQKNVETAVQAIEADPYVQFCMTGRRVDGMRTTVDRSGTGRFPGLTQQVRTIIANAALKIAKDNYYNEFDKLVTKMEQDYVTIGERMAENEQQNAMDGRREAAREACVNNSKTSNAAYARYESSNRRTGSTRQDETSYLQLMTDVNGVFQYDVNTGATTDLSTMKLSGTTTSNAYNRRSSTTSTFNWDTLVCHRCTTTQICTKPKSVRKVCKKWADPVENCQDIQF